MVTAVHQRVPAGLFGQTRAAVLDLLLLRPDERFHLRQIARLTGAGLGGVQRELAALTRLGVLHREQSGKQVYFQADRACPFFAELQGLVAKTTGVVGALRAALATVSPRVSAAAVFGSAARGTMTAGSDVDLLVVSPDLTVRELAPALRQAGQSLGRVVNVNLYRPQEWARRVAEGHPLASSILREPRLVVVGGPHELERLAEERVAEAAPAEPH